MPDFLTPPPLEDDPLEPLSRFQEALESPPPIPLDGDPFSTLALELLGAQTHIQILGNPGTGKTELLAYMREHLRDKGETCLLISGKRTLSRFAFLPPVASFIHSTWSALHDHLGRGVDRAASRTVLHDLRENIARIESFDWPVAPKPALVSGMLNGMVSTLTAARKFAGNLHLQLDDADRNGIASTPGAMPVLLRAFHECDIRLHWTETRSDLLNRTKRIAELNQTTDRIQACLNNPIEAIETTQAQLAPILQHYGATAGIESRQELLSSDARTRLHFASGGRRGQLLGLLRAATRSALTRLLKDPHHPRGLKVRIEDINLAAFNTGQWKIEHLTELAEYRADFDGSMALLGRIRAACIEQTGFNVCLLSISADCRPRAALIKAGLIHPFNYYVGKPDQLTASGRVHYQAYLLDYSQYTGGYTSARVQIFCRHSSSDGWKKSILQSGVLITG